MDKATIKQVTYKLLILFLVFTPILGFWIVIASNHLFQSFLTLSYQQTSINQNNNLFKNVNLPTASSFWLLIALGSFFYLCAFAFILVPWFIFPKLIKKFQNQNLSTRKWELQFSGFILTSLLLIFTGLILVGVAEYQYGYYSFFIKNIRSYPNPQALNNFLNQYVVNDKFKQFINHIYNLAVNNKNKFLWVTPVFVFMLTGFQILVAIFCIVRIDYRLIQILIYGEEFNKTKGLFFSNKEKNLRYLRLRWKELFLPSYKMVSFWIMVLCIGLILLNIIFEFKLLYPSAIGTNFIDYAFLYNRTFPPFGISKIYLDNLPTTLNNGYFIITQLPIISTFFLLIMICIYFFMGWKKNNLTKNYFLSFLIVSFLICSFDVLSYGLAGGILNQTINQWNKISALFPFNKKYFKAKLMPYIWLKTTPFVASVILIGGLVTIVHFIISYTVWRHGPEMRKVRLDKSSSIKEKKVNKIN